MTPGKTVTPASQGREPPLPWRSVWAARAVMVAGLFAGLPVFLRMPPWCDLTLYDVAARNVLTGGVHYRDVFDTNMPGFVWALAGLRSALGWSAEAVRAVDLLVVAAVVLLLDWLTAWGGASRAARAWTLAGVAWFYPFTSEFTHCQRDVWMTAPALAAAALRCRRLVGAEGRGLLAGGLVEGALWGLGVWIKPHVMVPAAALWVATAGVAARSGWRGVAADLVGNVAGGLAVGAAGVGYLIASGTWPYFVEVFTFWNTGYAAAMWRELPSRLDQQLFYFAPWSYLQLLALPVGVLTVVDGRPWRRTARPDAPGPVGRVLPPWLWDAGADERVRVSRLVLAAVYLGWTAQGLLLQRQFDYVHLPEVLMLLAVLATQRWAAAAAVLLWLAVTSALVWVGWAEPVQRAALAVTDKMVVFQHPAAEPGYRHVWRYCLRSDLPPAEYLRRMTATGRVRHFHAANHWDQLGEVADELRRRGVRDGEVLCWHDAPHAAYLLLGVRPGFRFMHVEQMIGIGPAQGERVYAELCAALPRVRYVVSDLMRVQADGPERVGDLTAAGPDLLPPGLIPEVRAAFPYDQPAVFRSAGGRGRYVIHEVRYPVRECREE